jgi:hypothetical protein
MRGEEHALRRRIRLLWLSTIHQEDEPGIVLGPHFVDWRERATSFDEPKSTFATFLLFNRILAWRSLALWTHQWNARLSGPPMGGAKRRTPI